MLVVAGISIVTSSGQGIGWSLLALGLISALVAAAFFHRPEDPPPAELSRPALKCSAHER
ncbi:hypothetical protein [Amycolatopsis regifaucium]|uniref:hypothetical protein n=1 Tax=Amycolatopsis regifaucium TaxID=546365 RepID=UPI0012E7708F|nr:hypothetical protein [Amycolatopsis regifaucium]